MKESAANIHNLENEIGYKFKNIKLLKQSLTHSSYSNEQRMKKKHNNERNEFLGDAVLELIVSEFLYEKYPELSEGELSKMRASIVCEQSLVCSTEKLKIGTYLYMGKGEELTGGRERHSIIADALEALIGAIFLDNGLEESKKFVYKFILNDIENSIKGEKLFFDAKTVLQEMIQERYKSPVSYELVEESGPDHDKSFKAQVTIEGQVIGTGEGKNKKSAEQEAAANAIDKIKNQQYGKGKGKNKKVVEQEAAANAIHTRENQQ